MKLSGSDWWSDINRFSADQSKHTKREYSSPALQHYEGHTGPMDPVDFIAGSVSGALGQIFGHPFDTVKVRMQTTPEVYNRGLINAFRLIFVREGALAVFQGVAAVSMLARKKAVMKIINTTSSLPEIKIMLE